MHRTLPNPRSLDFGRRLPSVILKERTEISFDFRPMLYGIVWVKHKLNVRCALYQCAHQNGYFLRIAAWCKLETGVQRAHDPHCFKQAKMTNVGRLKPEPAIESIAIQLRLW